jgi:hypothetical protein
VAAVKTPGPLKLAATTLLLNGATLPLSLDNYGSVANANVPLPAAAALPWALVVGQGVVFRTVPTQAEARTRAFVGYIGALAGPHGCAAVAVGGVTAGCAERSRAVLGGLSGLSPAAAGIPPARRP